MNQKQLANVLIKILGLSLCAEGAARTVYGIVTMIATVSTRSNVGGIYSVLLFNLLPNLILAAIGVFFIVQSRLIADKLFKDESE